MIKQNVLEVNNFVDYTLDDDSSFINTVKTPKQLQEELFERKKNKIQNYSYSTNLFHFFKENNQVNCFFGIDTVSYVKDNNPLKFLNNQEEFNNYIVSNNPVESIDGYVYADKQHAFVATNEFSIDLQDVIGRVYGFTFNLPKEFERSNMYGYEARISFRNIPEHHKYYWATGLLYRDFLINFFKTHPLWKETSKHKMYQKEFKNPKFK